MRKILLTVIPAFVCFTVFSRDFVHPGIDLKGEDLEYMKEKVLAGESPWEDAYILVKKSIPMEKEFVPFAHVIRGAYGKPSIGSNELMEASRQAYACALVWYVSREEIYARKALEIIDAWAGTLRSFDENDAKLLVALTGYEFCNAAEILRYSYDGWTQEHTQKVTDFLMSAFYPVIRYYFTTANGNWNGAIIHTLLAISVFTDNSDLFDNAVDHYLHSPNNGSIIKYVFPSGQCQETERDMSHVQMGLWEFGGAARVAYSQGVDLLAAADCRLALGMEYSAKWITGNEVFCYGKPSELYRDSYRSGFEYFVDHFTAKGYAMPYLQQLCRLAPCENQASGIRLLTAFRYEFRNKPSQIKELCASPTAYPAGTRDYAFEYEKSVCVTTVEDLEKAISEHQGDGCAIVLKAGDYHLNHSLEIPSGVKICGEGTKTVIYCTDAVKTAAVLLTGQDIHDIAFENLCFEGCRHRNTGIDPNAGRFDRTGRFSNSIAGISLRGQTGHGIRNVSFKNITVCNFSRSGLYISDAENITVDNCNFFDNGTQAVPGPRLEHNLHIQHSVNISIVNSRLDNSLFGCGLVLDHCKGVLLDCCEIARNGWHGVLVSESSDLKMTGCLNEGNDGCGLMLEYLYHGSDNVSVTDNVFQYNNEYAVKSYSSDKLVCRSNICILNGHDEKQDFLSSEKINQFDKL